MSTNRVLCVRKKGIGQQGKMTVCQTKRKKEQTPKEIEKHRTNEERNKGRKKGNTIKRATTARGAHDVLNLQSEAHWGGGGGAIFA